MILRMSCSYKLHAGIICLYLCILLEPSLSDILIYKANSNQTVEIIGDLPSIFGPSLPLDGFKGYIVYASPPEACITPAPPPDNHIGPFIALVKRYNCSFVDKVLNVQKAGYQAVIVRNVGSNSIEVMSGDHDRDWVVIPSVFIGQDDGILLEEKYQYNTGFVAVITDDLPFNIQNYLLPFAITIGICFILMLTFMLVKCIRDYRRSRRHRLSSRALRKIPIHKFKKGDPYDCCAVCLEDYADNDKLRILPCSHAYHSKCIDPWLTKNRRVCPVCKRKVIIGDEQPSELDSESEDENTPLINAEGGTQGGTFNPQRENPFEEAEREVERTGRNIQSQLYQQLNDSSDESLEDEEPPRIHIRSEEIYRSSEAQALSSHGDDSKENLLTEVKVPCEHGNSEAAIGFETPSVLGKGLDAKDYNV